MIDEGIVESLKLEKVLELEKKLGIDISRRKYIKKQYYQRSKPIITEVPFIHGEPLFELMDFLEFFEMFYLSAKDYESKYNEHRNHVNLHYYGLNNLQLAALCWSNTTGLSIGSAKLLTTAGEFDYLSHIALMHQEGEDKDGKIKNYPLFEDRV